MDPTRLLRRFMPPLIVVIGIFYCFPFVRPLHLESDSVCYLHTAELIADGQGFGCPGCDRTHCSIDYPPGYPWVLSLLIRGNFTPRGLVLLNVTTLLVGVAAAFALWRRAYRLDRSVAFGLAALVGLSLPVYRYVVNPLSDFLFFGLALSAVCVMSVSATQTGWRRAAGLVSAAVLAVCAFEVRTVGIALFPALLWAALGRERELRWLRGQVLGNPMRRAVFLIGLVLVGVGVVAVVSRSDYATVDLRTQYAGGVAAVLVRVLGYHLAELGALAVNVPAGKLPPQLRPVLQVIGAGGLALLVGSLWRRRREIGPPEVFLAATSAIILVWPFEDVRFWLPVLPLAFGLVAWALAPALRRTGPRWAVSVGLAGFVAFGLAGQSYSARLSLMGDGFPYVFADDYLGPVYRAAWGLRSPNDVSSVDPTALHVLQRFEPRARPRDNRPGS